LNRGYAKGGRAGFVHGSVAKLGKKARRLLGRVGKKGSFKTHGRDVPTMAAEGGRAGYAVGSAVKGIGSILAKKFKKKKVYPETEDLTHQKGPYVGDVGSEGKKLGPKAGRPKSPGRRPEGRKPPKYKPPIGKWPAPKRKSKPPIGKFPPEKGKWQKVAEGGRIGAQEGKYITKKKKTPNNPRWPKGYDPKKQQDPKEWKRIGFKKGTDKKWMQKVSASIKKRGTKGKCTPITKPGCTGRALALAKTFKKIAAKRKA